MKIIKIIAIVFVGIIVVGLIAGFILPGTYEVKRSLVINAPDSLIFQKIVTPREWNNWAAWNSQADTTMKYTYSGPESGVGAIMTWDSKNSGNGEMTIDTAVNYSKIRYKLLMENKKFLGHGGFDLKRNNDNGIEVTWVDKGDVGMNPIYRLMVNLFMNKMLGEHFEIGLKKLKENCEGASKA